MDDEPAAAGSAASRGPKPKVVLGKDGKPVPQPEKSWLQKNWLLIMIGAAVVSPTFPFPI